MEHKLFDKRLSGVLERMRNACLTAAGVSADATTGDIELDNAQTIVINGQIYSNEAVAAIDLSADATVGGVKIPAGKKAAILVLVNATGTEKLMLTNIVAAAGDIVIPEFDTAAYVCVAAVKISNGTAVDFTIGTTALNTASVTTTYIDVFNVIPGEIPPWS